MGLQRGCVITCLQLAYRGQQRTLLFAELPCQIVAYILRTRSTKYLIVQGFIYAVVVRVMKFLFHLWRRGLLRRQPFAFLDWPVVMNS